MSWILIYTKPKAEVDTNLRLLDKGFNSYLPMVYSDKRIKKSTSIETMFPRYLFVHFTEGEDDMYQIKKTKGVSNVVYFGEGPGYVADVLIEGIKSRHDKHDLIDIWKDYEEGDEIWVKDGPFKNYGAIFLTCDKHQRVAILLNESQKIVVLHKNQIEPKVA